MNEKKKFNQVVKEWWKENEKVVKTGIVCGLAGIAYGFIKGTLTVTNMLINGDITVVKPEKPHDELGLTEDMIDDPEYVELVAFENENS